MLEAITQKVDRSAVRHPNGEKVARSFADKSVSSPILVNQEASVAALISQSPAIVRQKPATAPCRHIPHSTLEQQAQLDSADDVIVTHTSPATCDVIVTGATPARLRDDDVMVTNVTPGFRSPAN